MIKLWKLKIDKEVGEKFLIKMTYKYEEKKQKEDIVSKRVRKKNINSKIFKKIEEEPKI